MPEDMLLKHIFADVAAHLSFFSSPLSVMNPSNMCWPFFQSFPGSRSVAAASIDDKSH